MNVVLSDNKSSKIYLVFYSLIFDLRGGQSQKWNEKNQTALAYSMQIAANGIYHIFAKTDSKYCTIVMRYV